MSFSDFGWGFQPETENQTVPLIEKIKKNSRDLNAMEATFNELGGLRRQGDLENPNTRKQLEDARDACDNFWIKLRLGNLLHRPLDNWGRGLKTALLSAEYVYTGLDERELGDMSDQELDEAFDNYRLENYQYFEWQERINLKGDFETGLEYLREDYALEPESFYDRSDDPIIWERGFRDTTITRLDKHHGAIYSEGGNLETVFSLLPEVENAAEVRKNTFGDHDRDRHEFLRNAMDQAVRTKNFDNLFLYLQFRGNLPDAIREKLDQALNTPIPTEFDQTKNRDEFEASIAPEKEKWKKLFIAIGPSFTPLALTELQRLVEEETNDYRNRHAGCALDRSQLSVLLECASNDAKGKHSTTPYHTILRFFLNRHEFPPDVIEAFDRNFPGVAQKIDLSDVKSFGDYLDLPPNRLWRYLNDLGPQRQAIGSWLVRNIIDLTSEIQRSLPEPETYSAEEFISKGQSTHPQKPNEAQQETNDYLFLMSLPVRKELEANFGFNLAELSFREQIQFLNFIKSGEKETVERVSALIKNFGPVAARCFLSCEYGKKYGPAILDIADRFSKADAQKIFERYGQTIDLAETDAAKLTTDFFIVEKKTPIDSGRLANELMLRAKEIIGSASQAKTEEIIRLLENAQRDQILFASIFKTAFKNHPGQVDFSEIRGMELTSEDRRKLSLAEIEIMRKVLRENWSAIKPEAVPQIIEEFDEKINTQEFETRFLLLRKDGEVIGFLSFSEGHPAAPDGVYGDSFNVRPYLMSSGIGSAFLEQAMKQEVRTHTVYCHADAAAPVAKMYVERFGFKIIGEEIDRSRPEKPITWLKLRREAETQRAEVAQVAQRHRLPVPKKIQKFVASNHIASGPP